MAQQEVYFYGCSDQEPEFRYRDPCPSYHQVHDSCDVNESNHGSYSTSKVTEPERLQMPTDDGWDASRGMSTPPPGLPSTPLSSWEPYPDTGTTTTPWVFQRYVLRKPTEAQESAPLIVEPLDMPHLRHPAVAMPFVQCNLAFSPNDSLCRTLMTRFSLAMTRMSRPYETGLQRG